MSSLNSTITSYGTAAVNAARQVINQFIRTSGTTTVRRTLMLLPSIPQQAPCCQPFNLTALSAAQVTCCIQTEPVTRR